MANFYKQGGSYYTTDGKKILTTKDLAEASKSGVEVVAGTNTPVIKAPTTNVKTDVIRPGAYGASDWRSYQALKDAGTAIINMRNDQNKDLNTAQTMWDASYKDITPFGGKKAQGAPTVGSYLDNANFRELSPADQASLIASRQGVALANLQTIGDERQYREKATGSALDNVTKMYELQQTAKERETDNLRQQRAEDRADVAAGLAYVNEKGEVVRGQAPTPELETYASSLGGFSVSQAYDEPVSYIKGRAIHGGYDIATPIGTPAKAPAEGVIVDIGRDKGDGTGWGNYVIVKSKDGSTWRLAHLDSSAVKLGERVGKGAILGYTGNTGKSTGPHLHIEQKDKNGNLVDFGKSAGLRSSGNKLSQTALIELGSKTGIDPVELKTYSAQQIADLKSTLLKEDQTEADKTFASMKPAERASMLARLGPKFGAEDGLKALLEVYFTGGENLRDYLYTKDTSGQWIIKPTFAKRGVTQDDIDLLFAHFDKFLN